MTNDLVKIEPDKALVSVADKFKIGDRIDVVDFFWISDADLIGFDRDAKHGHEVKSGSVDVGCTLEVRGFSGGNAIVSLMRPEVPYGAPAAIGTVFQISLKDLRSWPEKARKIKDDAERKKAMAVKFCK